MKSNIVLTGSSKGLGLSIASILLGANWNVYAIIRTVTDELKNLKEKHPNSLEIFKFDLEKTEDIEKNVFKHFLPLTIPIHGFINNAAIAYDDLITNINLETLNKMFKINVFSPMIFTKNIIRNMLFNQIKGSFIHVSSISVHTGYKGLAMYASSKGALEAFSKNIAREWGERNIRSNCVVAGFMETEMSSSLTPEQKDRIYKRTSLKKATSVESVAQTVQFLLSPMSESITGQNFFVDSGTI